MYVDINNSKLVDNSPNRIQNSGDIRNGVVGITKEGQVVTGTLKKSEELEAEVELLTEERDALIIRRDELIDELAEAEQTIAEKQETIETLEGQIEELDAQIATLNEQIDDLNAAILMYQSNLSDINNLADQILA